MHAFLRARSLRCTATPRTVRKQRSTHRSFTVLAIESSADDTCASVVTSDRQILSNVVVRQDSYHTGSPAANGKPGVVTRALEEARISIDDVDGIAVTRGPGIAGCLSVGNNAAKTLAAVLKKPFVGVHHMQAHALTPFLTSPKAELPTYPFLTLLVSGGHTLLLLATSAKDYRILATALDESIGQAFDKVSRLLFIPWSDRGLGAALEQYVLAGPPDPGRVKPDVHNIPVPIPGKMAFSFSAFHSVIDRFMRERSGSLDELTRYTLARDFQRAAVAHLEEKLALALRKCREENIEIRHLVVSGGVASNAFLRERLRICLETAHPTSIALAFPPPALCTDNAAMIAWASMERFLTGDTDSYGIDLKSRWSIEELETPNQNVSRV